MGYFSALGNKLYNFSKNFHIFELLTLAGKA